MPRPCLSNRAARDPNPRLHGDEGRPRGNRRAELGPRQGTGGHSGMWHGASALPRRGHGRLCLLQDEGSTRLALAKATEAFREVHAGRVAGGFPLVPGTSKIDFAHAWECVLF